MALARAEYEARVTQFRAELVTLDRTGGRLANLRTLTFVGFLVLGFLVGFDKIPRWGLLGSLACLAGYIALAVVHAGVIRREDFAKMRLSLNERGLLRLQGRWHDFPSTGAGRVPEGHLYGGDLDITGRGSLFQRLDDTGTAAGEQRLLDWLLTPAESADSVRARQEAVRELAPLIDFRQSLVAEARMAGKKDKADPSRFLSWAESPSTLTAIRWAWPIAHVLPVLTIGAGLLAGNDVINALPFYLGLFLQIGIVVATRKPIAAMWEALSMGERGFVRFEETFHAIDAQKFQGARLAALQRGLMDGPPVSQRLRQFARLMGFAELKHSGQMHPIINALTLWDLLVLFRIDGWRERNGKGVRLWFESLAELEALSSFATWHFERPEDAFPEVDDGPVHVEATELGHPLLGEAGAQRRAPRRPGERAGDHRLEHEREDHPDARHRLEHGDGAGGAAGVRRGDEGLAGAGADQHAGA